MTPLSLDFLMSLNASALLKIKNPVALFPSNKDGVDQVRRKLISKWHPDRMADADRTAANDVVAHLNFLSDRALGQLNSGVWGAAFFKTVETSGSNLTFGYYKTEDCPDFATIYYGKTKVWFEVKPGNDDLLALWERNRKKWKTLPNPDMAKDVNLAKATDLDYGFRPLPNKGVLIFLPTPGLLCLKHVLLKGPLPTEHVAWILTRLYELASLMQIQGVVNLDLSTKSVMINCTTHGVVLIDGLQYCESLGKKPLAIPSRTARLCPSLAAKGTTLMNHVLTLIKELGKECLGAKSNAMMLSSGAPSQLKKWLAEPAGVDALKELSKWKTVRDLAFGPPKWVPLNLSMEDIYES
jgi:hypothetical protein